MNPRTDPTREGPPGPAAEHWYELCDLALSPIGTYLTQKEALSTLRYEWPPRTVLLLRRWVRRPGDGPELEVQWLANYDLSGRLRATRTRRHWPL